MLEAGKLVIDPIVLCDLILKHSQELVCNDEIYVRLVIGLDHLVL